MSSRILHAFGDSGQVVRYDRSGRWYFEVPPEVTKGAAHRERLKIGAAVERAIWLWREDNGSINFGRFGGSTFDRKVRERIGGSR